jgi:hypothetical protein
MGASACWINERTRTGLSLRRGKSPAAPAVVWVFASSGFDWADAGIGAGAGLGLVLLAGAGVLVTRRKLVSV